MGGGKSDFELYDRGPMRSIGAWHVPQLQLEMLCAGPECRSALFASCSASRGASLFRMQRDDQYIACMVALLRVFVDRYLDPNAGPYSPPPDFFAKCPPPPQAFEGLGARFEPPAASRAASAAAAADPGVDPRTLQDRAGAGAGARTRAGGQRGGQGGEVGPGAGSEAGAGNEGGGPAGLGAELYGRFLARTVEIASEAPHLARIEERHMQRKPDARGPFSDGPISQPTGDF